MKKQLVFWLVLMACKSLQAQTPVPAFKLTAGYYQYSGGATQNGPATDINLRHSADDGNMWIAHYASWAHDVAQTRVGWDHSYAWPLVRVIPSLQFASAGAWTSSIYFETGETWFAGAGLGRTNLRDSLSLNFDPNDSYTVSGGYRWNEVSSAAFVLIRDNRLNPDQQHLHLIYRTALPEQHRLTIDVLLKSGTVEGEYIERTGLAVTYDWPRWFGRIAYDPKTNFTTQDLLRLVFGTRF
jgi:hypothetical protein